MGSGNKERSQVCLASWIEVLGRDALTGRPNLGNSKWNAQVARNSAEVRLLDWSRLAVGGGIVLQTLEIVSQPNLPGFDCTDLVGWTVKNTVLSKDGRIYGVGDRIRWDLTPLWEDLR